jgi:hypothetical protein
MKLRIKILLLCLFFLIGCGIGNGSSHKKSDSNTNTAVSTTPTVSISNTDTVSKCIDVYTLGNIVNAAVRDDKGQIASYDFNKSKYCFSNTIYYPVSVKVLPDTFIDVDYDNKKSANDIKPKFKELKSYYNYIDLITDMHAREVNLSVERNLTISENSDINGSEINSTEKINPTEIVDYYKNLVKNEIKNKYDINLIKNSINERILNFAAYDFYLNTGTLPTMATDLFVEYNNLKIFFDNSLNNLSITDKVKYYSFYHSLELLDKKLLQRVDIIHKPEITYLHKNNLPITDPTVVKSYYHNVIAKDIAINTNGVYTASGLDGVAKYIDVPGYSDTDYNNSEFTLSKKIKISDTFSNSYNLDIFSYSYNNFKKEYLFVADGGEGVSIIDITGGNFNIINSIMWKYYDAVQDKNISITIDDSQGLKQIDDVISIKTYISPGENKMWLAFGTKNKGLYLVDLKKTLFKIQNSLYPVIVYNPENDVNNTLWISGDGGTVYSEEFSSNGENLYAIKENTIERYDLSSVLALSNPTPVTYTIKSDNAYNLKMIIKSGIDELFVSTNKGVELYDVSNNGDLNFISEYTTEGAQNGYLPKMEYITDRNILLFTDGYKGLKAIKYDDPYNPRLCGIGYFSFYNDKTKLAKVNSVTAYYDTNDNNYYVIAGVEGYGLIKFKLDDLLFKHCQ